MPGPQTGDMRQIRQMMSALSLALNFSGHVCEKKNKRLIRTVFWVTT